MEAIDAEKYKMFRPEVKDEKEREKITMELDLDYYDKAYSSENKMHFNVPGIGFLGSPFAMLEKQL